VSKPPATASAESGGVESPLTRSVQKVKRATDELLRRFAPVRSGRRWIEREQSYHDQKDAESLAAARFPAGEEVGLRCVWVLEVFLASHVAGLKKRLAELHLGEEEYGSIAPTVASLLKDREHGGNTWPASLGYLVPPEAAPRSIGKAAILPMGVESAFFAAVTSIPGATVVVAQFRFDEQTARQIEEPFRTLYRSQPVLRDGGTLTLPDGTHLRDEAVIDIRSNLRRRCQRWMCENLPGAFAGLSEESPACELITLVKGDPFNGRHPPSGDGRKVTLVGPAPPSERPVSRGLGKEDYLTILGQRGGSDAWGCVEMRCLSLRLNRRVDSFWPDHNCLVLSARVGDFEFENGDSSAGTPTGVVNRTYWLNQTFGIFALSRLIGVFESRVAKLADALGEVRLGRNRRAVPQMEEIETRLAEITRDARPLLKGIVATPEWVWGDVYTFLPFEDFDRYKGPLFSSMTAYLAARSTRLLAAEDDLRSTVHGLSGLVAASANLAAARTNVRLQRVAIVIATIAVVVSALASSELRGVIQEWWHGIRR
jgi:hypothetical protein